MSDRDQQIEKYNSAIRAMVAGDYEKSHVIIELSPDESLVSTAQRSNRGLAQYLLGDYDAALRYYLMARSAPPANHSVNEIGVALWALGRLDEACEDWFLEIRRIETGEVIYSDAAGGVRTSALLWWAANRIRSKEWLNIATKSLERLDSEKRRNNDWPEPILQYILGKLDGSGLLEQCFSLKYKNVQANRESEAHFYMSAGMHEHAGYYEALQVAVSKKISVMSDSYLLSVAELRKAGKHE